MLVGYISEMIISASLAIIISYPSRARGIIVEYLPYGLPLDHFLGYMQPINCKTSGVVNVVYCLLLQTEHSSKQCTTQNGQHQTFH